MTGTSTTTAARPISFGRATALVAEREIRMRLRSKAFLISTAILMLAVLASIVIGGLTSKSPSDTRVAVVGAAAADALAGAPGLDITSVADESAAKALVREGTVDAAILQSSDPTGFSIIALDSPPSGLVESLSISPKVELLNPDATNPGLLYLVALGFGLVFFMSAITFGSTIAQSVVEEKQTRVVEILMSAIPVRALLAGKVIGNSILALGQIVLIAAIAGIGLSITGAGTLIGQLGPSVAWFIVFFAIGFVLLASMFSAAAALVSRQEDVGAVTSPVTMLVMIPYFLVIFFNDNDLVLTIMSYVPFSAPVGMPMRIFTGDAQWWEPVVSLVVMLVVTAVIIAIGTRVYSNSLLRTGARVKLSEALRG